MLIASLSNFDKLLDSRDHSGLAADSRDFIRLKLTIGGELGKLEALVKDLAETNKKEVEKKRRLEAAVAQREGAMELQGQSQKFMNTIESIFNTKVRMLKEQVEQEKYERKVVEQAQVQTMANMQKEIKMDRVKEIERYQELNRKEELHKKYVKAGENLKSIRYAHPVIKSILESTRGFVIYQEQFMLLAQRLSGFNPGESDQMRKTLVKKSLDMNEKKAKEREELRRRFIGGAISISGLAESPATELYETIEKNYPECKPTAAKRELEGWDKEFV
jgi:hypothetical protein